MTLIRSTVLLYDKGENDEQFSVLVAKHSSVTFKVSLVYNIYMRAVKRFDTLFQKIFKKFFICVFT